MCDAVTGFLGVRSQTSRVFVAKNSACIAGPILLESVVNQDGLPSFPHRITSKDPVLTMAALEAYRDWRFEPARVDGKPVRVYFNFTINFGLRCC
jgi:periplasmic protein TonB